MQIFARGLQNQIITTAQQKPGLALFDPLHDLGGSIAGDISVGRLQIFARLPIHNLESDVNDNNKNFKMKPTDHE